MAARLDKLIVSHATHKIIAYKSLILDASGQIFTNNTNKNYKTCHFLDNECAHYILIP